MNRAYRRASARQSAKHTTEPSAYRKLTHRLPPQVCVLYVPDRGYVAGLVPQTFRIVEDVAQATPYIDDEASTVALAFREMTGLRVAIRPYRCSHVTQH